MDTYGLCFFWLGFVCTTKCKIPDQIMFFSYDAVSGSNITHEYACVSLVLAAQSIDAPFLWDGALSFRDDFAEKMSLANVSTPCIS